MGRPRFAEIPLHNLLENREPRKRWAKKSFQSTQVAAKAHTRPVSNFLYSSQDIQVSISPMSHEETEPERRYCTPLGIGYECVRGSEVCYWRVTGAKMKRGPEGGGGGYLSAKVSIWWGMRQTALQRDRKVASDGCRQIRFQKAQRVQSPQALLLPAYASLLPTSYLTLWRYLGLSQ